MKSLKLLTISLMLAGAAMLPAAAFANAPAGAVTVTDGTAANMVSVDKLIGLIGDSDSPALAQLEMGNTFQVFDLNQLVSPGIMEKLQSAEAKSMSTVDALQHDVRADYELADWFRSHNIDISRLAAICKDGTTIQIYLL